MKSVKLRSKIGSDGFLSVKIPTNVREKVVDVLVVYDIREHMNDFQSSDWPESYFENTFGSLAADPIERPPQGAYPVREHLK